MKKITFLILLITQVAIGQVTVTQSNLPIILIDTKGQEVNADTKIVADMSIIDGGKNDNKVTDIATYQGKIGIELRGSSSIEISQRLPYAVETRKDDGVTDKNVALLGMAKESDWVFLAPYSDKTLIRDAFMYSLARKTMKWASDFRFADVFVNSKYEGIYMVTERIKRDSNRLNINKMQATDTQGDALTGGYIFAIDKLKNGDVYFNSKYVMPNNTGHFAEHIITAPDKKVINTQQKTYIKNYMQKIEELFAKNQHKDPVTGYQKWLDMGSFVDFVLLNELSRNIDAYRLSTYFHKDLDSKSTKLFAGPIWDFNIALGNADYCNADMTQGWAMDFNKVCLDDYWIIAPWWEKLFKDPVFQSAMKKRWQTLRKNEYSDAELLKLVDNLKNKVGNAQAHHFKRFNILGTKVWPNPVAYGTYNGEINGLKTFITARTKWLDGEIDKFVTITATENVEDFDIKIFPNPSEDYIYFEMSGKNLSQDVQIKIFDLTGKLMSTTISEVDNIFTLNVENFATGIYYYQIVDKGKIMKSGRVVKM
jgi:CotH kinase protein/Secretion system C-terminal sorting domain